MDRRCSRETDSTISARVGRALATALEVACKAAVAAVGTALFLGMLIPRPGVSETPSASPTARVDVHEEGNEIRIVPQYAAGKGFPRLVLHDGIGREICTVEYPKTGPAIYFGGPSASTPAQLHLWVKPGIGLSWCAIGQRVTTDVNMEPDGSANVSVRGTGVSGTAIGRIRVPAEGKPTVSLDGT